jgi:N-methylhydantoinase B/oxoprolinase/acetone carboxylase alpha subunit
MFDESEPTMTSRPSWILITERRHSRPWGLAGGEPGATGENWLLPGGDESRAEQLLDKCTIRMRRGDVVRLLTPGGGGCAVRPR